MQFQPDGKFSWTYLKDAKTTEFAGAYSINDDGLLVLQSPDSQMVANVSLPAERQLNFVLVGGPPRRSRPRLQETLSKSFRITGRATSGVS